MKPIHVKLIVASVAVVLAVGFLALVGVIKAQVYYLEVDQFLDDPGFHARTVRLCGVVAPGSIVKVSPLVTRFDLAGRRNRLPVHYTGPLPDLFQAGGEVVVTGKLDGKGVFQSEELMTKCASKYKPADYPSTQGEGQ